MTMGIVIIKSLFIVVVLESSARKSQTGRAALGDSKKVKRDQLIQAAFPNIVTYEFKSSGRYFVRLFLVTTFEFSRALNSALRLPEARNSAVEMTQRRNHTDKWTSITNAPA